MPIQKTRIISLFEALFVTFLWSTSFILIKMGLEEINPLAFASYRYLIASLILLFPFFYQLRKRRNSRFSLKNVLLFLGLGFSGYFIAQGTLFLGLFYLTSVTVSFLLNLIPIFVLGLSVLFLSEQPSRVQLVGIVLTFIGVFVFFYGALEDIGIITGVLITLVGGVGWAVYLILCRRCFIDNNESVISLTSISMLLGALMLMATTGFSGNFVNVSFNGWMIILWISIINTAIAFLLWNHSLKNLNAIEASVLQNTMLIQVALLSFFFLQESITSQRAIGLIIVFFGVLLVQLRGLREKVKF